MRLLQLYYFKLLAENEHLLKTANIIHISPPALSTSISRLEKELKVNLFDRVGRTIKLNENGQALYLHVCRIFDELEATKTFFSNAQSKEKEVLHVAVSAQPLWIEPISSFMKEHPTISIKHTSLSLKELQSAEVINKYDLIITDKHDISSKSWLSEFIVKDPPVLLINKSHPFAQKKRIPLISAKNESFIALSKDYSSRAFFENSCKQAGFEPKIAAETDYMLRVQLIEQGYGIGFSSVLGSQAITSPNVTFVRVTIPPKPRAQTVFWKKHSQHSKATHLFKEFICNFYKDNV